MLRRFRGSSSETSSDTSSSSRHYSRETNNSKDRETNNNNNGSNRSEHQAYTDDEAETMMIRLSLHQMAIGSVDTLRGKELDQVVPHPSSWREQPPLIVGPRGQDETSVLLKGVRHTHRERTETFCCLKEKRKQLCTIEHVLTLVRVCSFFVMI